MDPNMKEDEGYLPTALWTGAALAVVAGIAVYAGMQG
jgi:hypothetical protein